MSVEKKSKRTVNSSSSSSSNNEQKLLPSSASQQTQDTHPTVQKLVYFATEPDPTSNEKKEVKDYIEKLIAGQIRGETVKVSTSTGDGKETIETQVRKWNHVTPYPIEFVDPALDMKTLMFGKSGEQFIQTFQTPALRAQLTRRSYGPNPVHGWVFNFDSYGYNRHGQWTWAHADEVVAFGLKIIRREEATWACMNSIYQLPFEEIQKDINRIQQYGDGFPPEYRDADYIQNPLMSEIVRIINNEEKVDWVDFYDRWSEDVVAVISATTSPPTPMQQSRMIKALELVLGSDNARLVEADLQRCLLPMGKRQSLIPADFRFLFDFGYVDSWSDRMFVAQAWLWHLVRDSGNWKQRCWEIASAHHAKGDDSLTRATPGTDILATAFRQSKQEQSLAGDDPVALWQMAGPGVKKVIAGMVEHSPQLRKDRLVGNILNKKFLRESVASHPIHTLPGWRRLAPNRDSVTGQTINVVPGPAQQVLSFLGKATDAQRRDAVSRFSVLDDDDEDNKPSLRVVRRDYNTAPAGVYASFVRGGATKKKKLLS